jgi:threonine dehydrogenase-like Zn-dependent dehydrogenase
VTGDAQATGQAVVLERFGEPPVLREFPVPRAPADGMVVASRYGGVCGTDLHLQQGHLDVPVPLVLGHEGLGVVHELGAGIARDVLGVPLRKGDRVMWASSIACGQCVPCRSYREPTLCENRRTYGVNRSVQAGEPLSGSWAEYICLQPGTTVVKVPEGIADLAAMAFACAGPTMVHAIQERRPVRLGETVIVQGSGPVGLAAAAMAQLAGASLVGIVGGPERRLRLAREAGIGHAYINVIDAVGPDSVVDQVASMTGGRGADLVIEATGVPAALAQGVRMPRRGGSYLVVGQYTDSGDAMLNPHQIVYRQLDVVGSWAFTGAHLAEYVRLLPALSARFDLARLVTDYPIEKCGAALEDVAAGNVMKAVLVS